MVDKEKIKQRIIAVVSQNDPQSEVYLYGSQARGDSSETSDWDLLILLNQNKVSFELETKVMDDLYEVELETGEIISPLIYAKKYWDETHSSTPLYQNIIKEGIRIK